MLNHFIWKQTLTLIKNNLEQPNIDIANTWEINFEVKAIEQTVSQL